MTDFEDNFPTVIGRPVFDTERCPAPVDVHPYLAFLGGDAPMPKPTRTDLVLSARQWATRVRDEMHELSADATSTHNSRSVGYRAIFGALDRLDAALAELAAMEAK